MYSYLDDEDEQAKKDLLKNNLAEKYNLDPQTMQPRDAAQKDYEDRSSSINTANLFANLGDTIAGNKVGSQNQFFNQLKADAKADTVGKVEADRKRKLEDYQTSRMYKKGQLDDSNLQIESDVNSPISQSYQSMLIKMGMPPEKAKLLSASKAKQLAPSLEKIYEINQKSLDRADARSEKQKVLSQKQQELSTTQAKQAGLYKSGALAENQYRSATGTKGEYDPTSSGQWIDNSSWAPNWLKNNKSIEAHSAQDAWIESFLRDASGAAIAPSERSAYAVTYFPQPGDPQDVVDNKAALRLQKMESARDSAGVKANLGSGGAPMILGKGTILMKDPQGNVREVPENQVKAARAAGGVEI